MVGHRPFGFLVILSGWEFAKYSNFQRQNTRHNLAECLLSFLETISDAQGQVVCGSLFWWCMSSCAGECASSLFPPFPVLWDQVLEHNTSDPGAAACCKSPVLGVHSHRAQVFREQAVLVALLNHPPLYCSLELSASLRKLLAAPDQSLLGN